jgi:hypothetical protein
MAICAQTFAAAAAARMDDGLGKHPRTSRCSLASQQLLKHYPSNTASFSDAYWSVHCLVSALLLKCLRIGPQSKAFERTFAVNLTQIDQITDVSALAFPLVNLEQLTRSHGFASHSATFFFSNLLIRSQKKDL